MYNFNVRPATIKDVEAICKYNKTHGRSALSLEDTEAALQEIISDGTNDAMYANQVLSPSRRLRLASIHVILCINTYTRAMTNAPMAGLL